MTRQHRPEKLSQVPRVAEPDAATVEQVYGDEAEIYAEVREDTAQALGEGKQAEKWRSVQRALDADAPSANPASDESRH